MTIFNFNNAVFKIIFFGSCLKLLIIYVLGQKLLQYVLNKHIVTNIAYCK